ncbi:DUF4199 domain-containing protein [Algoriphagus confluentis]|uniref:DUF4199 domain-containing protein n=1 Tax=Algoriphagus confluentis TaxID=1697556 RepID=A0ABQ6PU35_9BACT|nr:hypothetical protein Aconfl_39070 [Algoriphagus confluentis]
MKNVRIEIKWGLLFILSGLIWMILEKSLGWHDLHLEKHATYTLFYAPIAILIYVLALLDKKRNDYHGKMTYFQGLISGVLVTFVVVGLTPLSQYITHTYISPDYFSNVIALSIQQGHLDEQGAKAYFSLRNYIFQSTIFAAVMGLLTSAVVSIFIRSRV